MKRNFFKSGILALSLIALFNVTGYCDSEVSQVKETNVLNTECNLSEIKKHNSQKVISKRGGGSVRVCLENSAKVYLDTGSVDINFQNANSSNQDSVITLCIMQGQNEYAIASSELVKVGTQIQTLKLSTDGISLMPGVYTGKYIINHYNPETHEKAAGTAIFSNINVTVK